MSQSDFVEAKHQMLQELLADRFKLQIHPETRVAATDELIAAPHARQLMTQVPDDPRAAAYCYGRPSEMRIEIQSKGCPFTMLVTRLQQTFGMEILDHTGLSGAYAYQLEFGWDASEMSPDDPAGQYPKLIDAIREPLGLDLRKTTGPVKFWIVDHVELPTQN